MLSSAGSSATLGSELASPSLEVARRARPFEPLAGGRAATRAIVALAGLVGTTSVVALSAGNTDQFLPESVRPIPDWLGGPIAHAGAHLGGGGAIAVLAATFVFYALVLRNVTALSGTLVLGAVALVLSIVLIAPPLVSTDVFSYMAYGRLGSLYGGNPYLLGPHAIALDPIYPYIGAKWVTIPTAYGPLFTLLSYPVAALDVAASVVAYKLVAAASAAVVVAAVWSSARVRGVDPVRATALVGLNPLLIVFGVGGGHNDLLMLAALAVGVHLLLIGRDRAGAGSIVAAVGVKLTGGIVLPFALAGHAGGRGSRRRSILAAAAAAALALAAVAYAFFGTGVVQLLGTLARSQSAGDWHNIPGFISMRLGLGTLGHLTSLLLALAFVVAFGLILRRVWQDRLDWIAGAGWATVAMLATASSLLPWYLAWLLPLAALARDPRLERVTIWMTGFVLTIQIVGYLPHAGAYLNL